MLYFKVGDKVMWNGVAHGSQMSSPREMVVGKVDEGDDTYPYEVGAEGYRGWWVSADSLSLIVNPSAPEPTAAERKARPIVRGFLDYFPDAVLAVEKDYNENQLDRDIYLSAEESLADPHHLAKEVVVALVDRDDEGNLRWLAYELLNEAETERAGNYKPSDKFKSFVDSFGETMLEIAHISYVGNEQHHPGAPLHWEFGRSTDHADCLLRHYLQRGTVDTDGVRHIYKAAWRAFALYQTWLERQDPELHALRQSQREAAAKGERL